ncbi:MAG: hypothetical protein VSS75_029690 [Candidatus Parabeggiatoa sp.]|nr:hypothetical protein [Candidatus Parabeggiatoa sp.]
MKALHSVNENLKQIRRELALLARRKEARIIGCPEKGMPSDWQPHQVINPEDGLPFTKSTAWYYIAKLLEDSQQALEEIVLHHPPGKRAFVLHVDMGPHLPKLYIKLQLGSGKVIGRSFHYSEKEQIESSDDANRERRT